MSTEQSSKNMSAGLFYIGIRGGESIASALRRFLTAVRYTNVKYGEKHYKNYLNKVGHQFKKDTKLARIAFDVKKSNIERYSVNKEDVQIIRDYARKFGMDFALTKKPEDLDRIVTKKFIDKEQLSSQEEKILRAFTYRDKTGNYIMDAENPNKPMISEDEHMLTIASVDLDRWELICREMEIRSHKPKFQDRLKTAIHQSKVINEYLKKINRERSISIFRKGRD